jgi:hypothetical protein
VDGDGPVGEVVASATDVMTCPVAGFNASNGDRSLQRVTADR